MCSIFPTQGMIIFIRDQETQDQKTQDQKAQRLAAFKVKPKLDQIGDGQDHTFSKQNRQTQK